MGKSNTQLRRERTLRGWSQAYLAQQIGTSDYYISRWERGAFVPSPYYQQKLCELFEKTAEELGFLPQPVDAMSVSDRHKINKETSCTFYDAEEIKNSRSVNPFSYGNPISDPRRFFGRKREIQQIVNRLRNTEFESSSLVGERRIGKTSLLKHLAHPAICQSNGLDPSKYLFVYIDLQVVDEHTTSVQLWQWLLRQIASGCTDPQVKQILEEVYRAPSIDNFALQDVFDAIDANDQYVVLLLDEFERVTENPNFHASFFYGLRSLVIQHHLSLITSSRCRLIELCHSQAISASPFFNIFATINLGLFTNDEALTFISQSLDGTDIHFIQAEVDALLRLAGSHPYFLQIACSFLFEAYYTNVEPDKVTLLHSAFLEEAEVYLASYWHHCDDHEKVVLTALTVLEGQQRSDGDHFSMHQLQDFHAYSGQTLNQLEKRGLVVSSGDACSLFNQSFGEWIWNEMTDTRYNQQGYTEWLASNKQVTDHLKSCPEVTKKVWDEILPKMKEEYRKLLLHWLIEPSVLTIVGELIKKLLVSGWRAPV